MGCSITNADLFFDKLEVKLCHKMEIETFDRVRLFELCRK